MLVRIFANIFKNKDEYYIKMELVRLEIPELFVSCLHGSSNDNDTILLGLVSINSFLEFSKKRLKGLLTKSFENLQIVTYLEDLALSKNQEISDSANCMLNKYYKNTEEIKV